VLVNVCLLVQTKEQTMQSINAQLELKQSQQALMELANKSSLSVAEHRKFDALLAKISLIKSGAISESNQC
jgi:hypothetical protein